MKHFLFVHFREKTSPDGEQVYFAISRGGFKWEPLHEGRPVLWAYYGDHGVRDMTITRAGDAFHIFATDLSLSYGMRGKYHKSWDEIKRHGSPYLAHWSSKDLVNWTEEELIRFGDQKMGCRWAPDILYDKAENDYIIHWSSATADDGYQQMGIYYSRTKDFVKYTDSEILYRPEDRTVIDSAMYEENGKYYLFVKCQNDPMRVILLRGETAVGPFERVQGFDRTMDIPNGGHYEAPTAIQLHDGRWCLFIDFFGVAGEKQGYRGYIADSLDSGEFHEADGEFFFPYRFKHGTALEITEDEYMRLKTHDWEKVMDGRF